ncbi:hypothetical protein N7513_007255 [Penicillium frequentans]|nr:hypothetical protein N7513_007255 [Penicillium glabrum]
MSRTEENTSPENHVKSPDDAIRIHQNALKERQEHNIGYSAEKTNLTSAEDSYANKKKGPHGSKIANKLDPFVGSKNTRADQQKPATRMPGWMVA